MISKVLKMLLQLWVYCFKRNLMETEAERNIIAGGNDNGNMTSMDDPDADIEVPWYSKAPS